MNRKGGFNRCVSLFISSSAKQSGVGADLHLFSPAGRSTRSGSFLSLAGILSKEEQSCHAVRCCCGARERRARRQVRARAGARFAAMHPFLRSFLSRGPP